MKERLAIFAERVIYKNRIDLVFMQKLHDGRNAVGQPLVMQTLEPDFVPHDPTASLDYESAQGLMDELWRCGLRPSEGTGSAGALAATEKHLNDMRRICTGLLTKNWDTKP